MKVYTAPSGDIDIPRLDILSILFDSSAGQAREDTCIHVEAANPKNSITKGQARNLTKRVAHTLRHRYGVGASGLGKDVVLAVLYGGPFAPVVFYGIVAAGGIYSGASAESTPGELATQIKSSEATTLICSPECDGLVIEAAKQGGLSADRVLVADGSAPSRWSLRSVNDTANLLHNPDVANLNWTAITDHQALENTTVCLLYSSGTTGLPKGVRIPHSALVANTVSTMQAAKDYQKTHPTFHFDTVAHLPMSNIAGIGLYSINPFYMGGTTYWMRKYNFDEFLKCHRRFKPAYQFSVPPVWLQVAKSDKVTDHFDGLMVASTGSAPIGYGTITEIRSKLGRGKADIYQTWGTTETTGVITALPWEAYVKHGIWSVGGLCPNVTLRILDEDDNDVRDGEPGELLVGGPFLAQGYYQRPDADAEAFGNPAGFYRTGDIGVHRGGQVYIVDRKKELIKYKATQVAPAELEALLTSHPSITDAAVIGLWDTVRQTEVPRAYVVPRQGTWITEEQVMEFVRGKVAQYKQLRGGVEFVDSIPKSPSGKILRKELRQRANAASTKAKL